MIWNHEYRIYLTVFTQEDHVVLDSWLIFRTFSHLWIIFNHFLDSPLTSNRSFRIKISEIRLKTVSIVHITILTLKYFPRKHKLRGIILLAKFWYDDLEKDQSPRTRNSSKIAPQIDPQSPYETLRVMYLMAKFIVLLRSNLVIYKQRKLQKRLTRHLEK